MKKNFVVIFASVLFALLCAAPKSSAASWKPVVPEGYSPITWAKAPGIATFYKAPAGNGSLDFITRVYLPQNFIHFIAATATPQDWGASTAADFAPQPKVQAAIYVEATTTAAADDSANAFHNFSFTRIAAEVSKQWVPAAKFIWNGPFFNVNLAASDLSMALKMTVGTTTLVTSGSRPDADIAEARRMFLLNNKTGTARVVDFDAADFVNIKNGDQAMEGFAPTVAKADAPGGRAARLFMGVTPDNKELVIYCTQSATVGEASDALLAAGVAPENQIEADGGGSAACGYNLPGQFFVEPSRTVPLLMGATTIVGRGTTSGANVRRGPATKYAVVAKLSKGEAVTIFEEKNGWYRIGDSQWVVKSLIKKI